MTGGTDESIAEAKKDSAFNMFCEIINNSSCTALYACRSRWRLCQLMRQSAGLDHYIFLSLSLYIYIFIWFVQIWEKPEAVAIFGKSVDPSAQD